MIENLFNRLSDLDWVQWPLLRLRPPKNKPLPRRILGGFLLVLSVGLVIAALILALLWMYVPELFHSHRPAGLEPSWRLLLWLLTWVMGSGTYQLVRSIAAPVAILFVYGYYWSWNRRAARLRQIDNTAPAVPSENASSLDGVWPPPPQQSRE